MLRGIDVSASDVFSCAHSFSFDFSVWEMFGAFAGCAELVVVPRDVVRSAEALAQACAEERHCPVANAIVVLCPHRTATQDVNQVPLRHVVFGGEGLNLPRIRPWWQSRDVNRASTAEQHVRHHRNNGSRRRIRSLTKAICHDQRSLIGGPLPSLSVYILDENLDPCLPGVTGEIYQQVFWVTQGYHRRSGLTASRFVADPSARWRTDVPIRRPRALGARY